jgi:predicted 3-demethylubiquinone-9 3-methyltransferase (glyoxalase superfamily)
MKKMTSCLWFDGQAEDAAKFYVSIFPHSKINGISRYGDIGQGRPGAVMTVAFELDGHSFMGLNGGPDFKFTEAVSFVIECKTQEEIDSYWSKLLAGGGQESVCGWLKDKFGLSWQVVPAQIQKWLTDPDQARVDRVMREVLKMKKLDLKTLERAYEGAREPATV